MALTATEEAQARQLIAQQAALLSLAGNEATITSKLGANKVTLSDLAAAGSVADADLLLTRQGVNDRSLTASLLAQYISAELGVTAPQFDNDTSLATTEFVQRALGNLRSETAVNSSTTLGAAAIGQLLVGSAGTYTTTLPLANSAPAGVRIHFLGTTGIGTWVVQRQGADVIDNNGGGTLFTIGTGDSAVLESNGVGTWRIVGGSVSLRNSADFGKSLAANGYQKLPSGLIVQWGPANFNTTPVGNTFPIAFPTQCYGVLVNRTGTVSFAVEVSVTSLSNTSFNLQSNTASGSFFYYAIGI